MEVITEITIEIITEISTEITSRTELNFNYSSGNL